MLAPDKKKHISAGFQIALAFGVLVSPLAGLILAAVAGATKEFVYDKFMKRGTPEVLDFVATCAGGLVGFLLFFIGR
jgi:heme O synthase-like polyprenyltransferase